MGELMATSYDLATEGVDVSGRHLLAGGGKEVAINTSGATKRDVNVDACGHFAAKIVFF
jgi:hypothetical protein